MADVVHCRLKEQKSFSILTVLGEKEPAQLMVSHRRTTRPTRDLALYILAHLGIVTNKAIGELFTIGYTAVTETLKRVAFLLVHNKELRRTR